MHDWIKKYRSNRKQRIVINGTASAWASVTSVVPHGSDLGPFLIIICINYVDIGLYNFTAKFVDGTQIGNSVNS